MMHLPEGAGKRLTRREAVLSVALAAAASSAASVLPSPSWAQGSNWAQGQNDFSAVSQVLTGRASLDPALRDALLARFMAQDEQFPAKLRALRQLTDRFGHDPEAFGAQLKNDGADLAALRGQILQGWYLGVVGEGEKAVCVTYTGALANAAVADVLRPPSYAYGEYGSWKSQPA